MKLLVGLIGAAIAALGIAGFLVPSLPPQVGAAFLSLPALLVLGAGRVLIGMALILVAPRTRFPNGLRILGALVVVAGIATPLFGVERTREVVDWLSSQGEEFIRSMMIAPIALGAFLVYAVASRVR